MSAPPGQRSFAPETAALHCSIPAQNAIRRIGCSDIRPTRPSSPLVHQGTLARQKQSDHAARGTHATRPLQPQARALCAACLATVRHPKDSHPLESANQQACACSCPPASAFPSKANAHQWWTPIPVTGQATVPAQPDGGADHQKPRLKPCSLHEFRLQPAESRQDISSLLGRLAGLLPHLTRLQRGHCWRLWHGRHSRPVHAVLPCGCSCICTFGCFRKWILSPTGGLQPWRFVHAQLACLQPSITTQEHQRQGEPYR